MKTKEALKIIFLILLVLTMVLFSVTVAFTESKYVVGVSLEHTSIVSLGDYGFKYTVSGENCYITSFVAEFDSSNNLVEYQPSDTSLGSLIYINSRWTLTFPSSYTQSGKTYTNFIINSTSPSTTNGFPIYNKSGTLKLCDGSKNNTTIKEVIIPSGITAIGIRSFYKYTVLTNITISSTVISIGTNAFKSCTALNTIYIPSSVTTINATTANNSPFSICKSSLVIYCGASSKQSGWGPYWNYYANNKRLTVRFGYTFAQYQALI